MHQPSIDITPSDSSSYRRSLMESNISALKAKFILLNFQNITSKFLEELTEKCSEISEYKVKQYDDLTALNTISLIKKETNSIRYYSCLIFCIFANCKNDGFRCCDRTIIFRELIQSFDVFQYKNEWATKHPILFLINDCRSNETQYSSFTKISSIFISVNTFKESQIFESLNQILEHSGNILFDKIGDVILSHKKVSQDKYTEINVTNTKRVETYDFLDNSNLKIEKFAKALYTISSRMKTLEGNKLTSLSEKQFIPEPSKTGKCVIFKYDFEELSKYHNLIWNQEAESNAKFLIDTFELMEFEKEVQMDQSNVHLNLPQKDMFRKINKLTALVDIDLYAVCLITYCEDDYFYCLDQKIPLKKLVKHLERSRFVNSTPTMLFILNCGHNKYDDFKSYELPYYLLQDRIKLPRNFVLFYTDCPVTDEYSKKEIPNFITTISQIFKINSQASLTSLTESEYGFMQVLFNTFKDYNDYFDFETIIRIAMFKNLFSLLSEYTYSHAQNTFFKSTVENSIFSNDFKRKQISSIIATRGFGFYCPGPLELFKTSEESYEICRGVCFLVKIQQTPSKTSKKESATFSKLKSTFQNLQFEKFIEIQHKNNDFEFNSLSSELLFELAINAHAYDCFALIFLTNGKSNLNQLLDKFIEFPLFPRKPKLIFVFDTIYKNFVNIETNSSLSLYSSESSHSDIEEKEGAIDLKVFWKSMKFIDYLLLYTLQINPQDCNSESLLSEFCDVISRNPTEDLMSMIGILFQNMSPEVNEKNRCSFFLHSSLTKLVKFNSNSFLNKTNEMYCEKSKEIVRNSPARMCVIFDCELVSLKKEYQNLKCNLLEETFINLKFSVVKHQQLNYSQIITKLHEISKTDYSNIECFVLCFFGHRINDDLYCDEKNYINTEYLIQSLSGNAALENKPKVLLMDTCRGFQKMESHDAIFNETITAKTPAKEWHFVYSDLFILTCIRKCYQTYLRDENKELFINTFCQALKMYHKTHDLLSIVTIVFSVVSQHKDFQMNFSSSLRNKIFI